jgi:large subunit ribosomal protein L21e
MSDHHFGGGSIAHLSLSFSSTSSSLFLSFSLSLFPSQQGMPHKVYHGRTGVVWNVTKRSLGVEVNKQVGGRIIKKRIHVRVEHVVPSRCKEEFLARRASNDAAKAAAKASGEAAPARKRTVAGPRDGFTLTDVKPQTVTAIPYDIVKDAKI